MATRPFRLSTKRLTIRLVGRDDITAFTHYRKIPEVAEFQDWPTPYTRDLAHELVDEMERLGGPTPGEWVQLALDPGDGIIGDVAVWLDEAGTFAMVGYTLDPVHQGNGYATEALTAVIDWLFRRKKVHRIAATIDPRNLASARVLERCGFTYVGTAHSAALVRGEWLDDARFSLLEPGWKAWNDRPTSSPDVVELIEVTDKNVRAVIRVETSFSQRNFVAPVSASLAQALVPPIEDGHPLVPWYRAVAADGEIVGFVMLAEPTAAEPHPYLWRFTIDYRHQGRGIGKRALQQVVNQQRAAGHTHLAVSYVRGEPGAPAPFYERLGFVPTGVVEDGEHEALLELTL